MFRKVMLLIMWFNFPNINKEVPKNTLWKISDFMLIKITDKCNN